MLASWRHATISVLAAVALAALSATAFAQSANLTVLHVNDVYEISPKKGKGGLAELMTLLRQERDPGRCRGGSPP